MKIKDDMSMSAIQNVDLGDIVDKLIDDNKTVIVFFQVEDKICMLSTSHVHKLIREDIIEFLNHFPEPN